jgi:hypothetical protein
MPGIILPSREKEKKEGNGSHGFLLERIKIGMVIKEPH